MEPQSFKFSLRKLEHEIFRETLQVTSNCSIKEFRLDAIEFRKVRVEHHPLPANQEDSPLDPLNRSIGF